MIRLLTVFFVGGLSTGILISGKFTPEWVEATGTWVGAFATVAAVVWAVESFRREARHREAEKVSAQKELDARQIRETEAKELAEKNAAAGVKVRCYGGGGSMGGPGEPSRMSSIHVEVANGSNKVVDVEQILLPGVGLSQGDLQQFLKPYGDGESLKAHVQTTPFAAANSEFSGKPLTFSTPTIQYRIEGVLWQREGDTGTPERLSG